MTIAPLTWSVGSLLFAKTWARAIENSGPGLLGRLDREVEDGAAAGVSVTLAALVKLRGNLCRSPPQGRAAGRYTDRAGTGIQAADHWPTKPPLPIAARRRGGRLRRAIAV